jgi:serine/threonine protein kinase
MEEQSWSSSSSTSSSWDTSVNIVTSCIDRNKNNTVEGQCIDQNSNNQKEQIQHHPHRHPLHENIVDIDCPQQQLSLDNDQEKSILKQLNSTTSNGKSKSSDKVSISHQDDDDNFTKQQHQKSINSSLPKLETLSTNDFDESRNKGLMEQKAEGSNKTHGINEFVMNSNFPIPPLQVPQQQQQSVSQVPTSVQLQVQQQQQQQQQLPVVQPSIEKERQLLILVLLAQVCALHDPTPRTFTIHVLELYERAILDTESISFLYEYGLVPPMSPSHSQPQQPSTDESNRKKEGENPINHDFVSIQKSPSTNNTNNYELKSQSKNDKAVIDSQQGKSDANTYNSAKLLEYTRIELLRQRSQEASAIRSMLSLLDQENDSIVTNNETKLKRLTSPVNATDTESDNEKKHTTSSGATINNNDSVPQESTAPSSNPTPTTSTSSWSVQEYQLSLSRYQREFKQVCLLSSGAFGLVFKAINLMDQREYAIKQIQFNATGYNRTSLERTMREVQCLAICDHPNIVRYYTSWFEPSWMTGATTTTPASTYNIEEENEDEDDYDDNNDDSTNQVSEIHRKRVLRRPRAQSSDLTQELKAYFKDPYFSSSEKKNKKTAKQSFPRQDYSSWTNESSNQQDIGDDDDDLSTWTISQQSRKQQWKQPELSVLSVTSSRDDIFFEESMTSERRMTFNNETACNTNWERSRDDSTIFDRSKQETSVLEWDDNYEQRQLVVRPKQQRHNSKAGKKHNNAYQLGTRYKYQICLYIQMQLCHPATLADWIRERNQNHQSSSTTASSVSVDDRIHSANQIFKQIVCGLSHVHQKGIIHRDLKPSNIFFCATTTTDTNNTCTELQFKIGDFGLSKVLSSKKNELTQSSKSARSSPRNDRTSSINDSIQMQQRFLITQGTGSNNTKWSEPLTAGVGTASYAAPEQVDTTTYSSAADIYSIGLILLELLCCFSTEHERLQTFYDCRTRRIVPKDIVDKYPIASKTILACTEPIATNRPTACDLELVEFVLVTALHPTYGLSKAGSSSVSPDSVTNNPRLLLTYDPTIVAESEDDIVTHERCTVDVDVATLRRQLEELQSKVDDYETMLDEKDAIIFDLRLEIDNIKNS